MRTHGQQHVDFPHLLLEALHQRVERLPVVFLATLRWRNHDVMIGVPILYSTSLQDIVVGIPPPVHRAVQFCQVHGCNPCIIEGLCVVVGVVKWTVRKRFLAGAMLGLGFWILAVTVVLSTIDGVVNAVGLGMVLEGRTLATPSWIEP